MTNLDSQNTATQPQSDNDGSGKTSWTGTYWYLGLAAASLLVTLGANWMNQPAAIAEYGQVGKEYFPEFADPTLATSLEVFAFDRDNVQPQQFQVARSENQQWVIPSHHNYPADAQERLAETAGSVIGIKRGAMVTRWESDHVEYGVVNPKQESLGIDEIEGVGQRLTLQGEDDAVLADFIIGNAVEDSDDEYYVRHPEEDEVYIATLNIDLSTKFTDWIDDQLFEMTASDVQRIMINDYSFDETDQRVTEAKLTQLDRSGENNEWALETLDPAKEELNTSVVTSTLSEIAGLEIIGVRPKQSGLTPDLKLDREIIKSQRDVQEVAMDLMARGFALTSDQNGDPSQLALLAREGELLAGMKDGVTYRMQFGRAFTGDQQEIESGFSKSEKKASGDSEARKKTEDAGESGSGADESKATESKPGRYLFVQVSFDASLLGDKLVEPVEPKMPESLKELSADKAAQQESTPDKAAANEKPDAEGSDKEATGQEKPDPKAKELDDLRMQHAMAMSKYSQDSQAFKEYQAKVDEGQKKAKKLNQRFANWYYVISGESYDELALDREKLITIKEAPAAPAVLPTEQPPISPPPQPGSKKAAEQKAAEESPAEKSDAVEDTKQPSEAKESGEGSEADSSEPEKAEMKEGESQPTQEPATGEEPAAGDTAEPKADVEEKTDVAPESEKPKTSDPASGQGGGTDPVEPAQTP